MDKIPAPRPPRARQLLVAVRALRSPCATLPRRPRAPLRRVPRTLQPRAPLHPAPCTLQPRAPLRPAPRALPMAFCARAAPVLLVHVTLLLALVAGAGLATAARLKWDPSTYIVVREMFPLEYRVAAAVLCAAAFALLALGHLAALALATARPAARRALFLTYAALMAALVCVEVSWAAWSGARVAAWLDSAQAQQVAQLLEVREHLQPILSFLAQWHPLPTKIQDIIQEATEDAPRNLYVGGAAVALVGALQPAAVLLALLCAAAARRRASAPRDSFSFSSTDNEKAPLKTAFKNGKLVIV